MEDSPPPPFWKEKTRCRAKASKSPNTQEKVERFTEPRHLTKVSSITGWGGDNWTNEPESCEKWKELFRPNSQREPDFCISKALQCFGDTKPIKEVNYCTNSAVETWKAIQIQPDLRWIAIGSCQHKSIKVIPSIKYNVYTFQVQQNPAITFPDVMVSHLLRYLAIGSGQNSETIVLEVVSAF